LVGSFHRRRPLEIVNGLKHPETTKTPLLLFKGVLQPKQVTVFIANFIKPPIVGVAIWIVRVCSPATDPISARRQGLGKDLNARRLPAFSPMIGSNILRRGLES